MLGRDLESIIAADALTSAGRPAGAGTVASFLATARERVSGLVVEGEPGIGKTTAWSAAIARALGAGFHVVSARAGSAEVVLAFAVLGDLFDEIDPEVLAKLPALQRVAVDRLLTQAGDSPATNERVLGAAFLGAIERLAESGPVLVAVSPATLNRWNHGIGSRRGRRCTT